MSNHDQHNNDQAGQVIEEIARREQEMQTLLTGAQKEAERIMDEARTQAEQLIKTTRSDLLRQAEEQTRITAQKNREIREQLLSQAGKEADELDKKAQANRQKAVEAVVNQILPEAR